jgi:hypothetical protein
MPKKKEEATPEAEGWQAEKHTSQPVYHYIVGTFALCGGLGFYTGELMPHKEGQKKGREDCSGCFKRLLKRLEKAAQQAEKQAANKGVDANAR